MNTERFLLSEKENVVVIIIAGNLLIYTGYNVVVVNGGKFLCVHDRFGSGSGSGLNICFVQNKFDKNKIGLSPQQNNRPRWNRSGKLLFLLLLYSSIALGIIVCDGTSPNEDEELSSSYKSITKHARNGITSAINTIPHTTWEWYYMC